MDTKKFHKHHWTIIRVGWPYCEEDSYGTICRGCRTILDTGLDKESAQIIVERMNLNGGRE